MQKPTSKRRFSKCVSDDYSCFDYDCRQTIQRRQDPVSCVGPEVLFRPDQRPEGVSVLLFISFKKGHTSDIRPTTPSSWLKQTILLCYIQADQHALDLVQVKVCDIRALAASKVFYGGVSVDQIMQACHWKAHNTFYKFLSKRPYLVRQRQQYLSGTSSTSLPGKEKGGHICYNQVFRRLSPGSRYRFTSSGCVG